MLSRAQGNRINSEIYFLRGRYPQKILSLGGGAEALLISKKIKVMRPKILIYKFLQNVKFEMDFFYLNV